MSVHDPYDFAWEGRVRTRIRRSPGVIALVSRRSLSSSSQERVIECADDAGRPIRGISTQFDDRTNTAGARTYVCSDENISDFIDSVWSGPR